MSDVKKYYRIFVEKTTTAMGLEIAVICGEIKSFENNAYVVYINTEKVEDVLCIEGVKKIEMCNAFLQSVVDIHQ